MRQVTKKATVTLLALGLAGVAHAELAHPAGARLLDLTPERVAAFRQALHEFATPARHAPTFVASELSLASRYTVPPPLLNGPLLGGLPPLPVTPGRDVVFEESVFLTGREDHVRRAARSWLERSVKGSSSHRSTTDSPWGLRAAWNHGPLLGVRRGLVSAQAGPSSWRVSLRRPLPAGGRSPWSLGASVGAEDGHLMASVVMGRSLRRASD